MQSPKNIDHINNLDEKSCYEDNEDNFQFNGNRMDKIVYDLRHNIETKRNQIIYYNSCSNNNNGNSYN